MINNNHNVVEMEEKVITSLQKITPNNSYYSFSLTLATKSSCVFLCYLKNSMEIIQYLYEKQTPLFAAIST